MTIDEEQCHVYMFPSMIGVDINVGLPSIPKGEIVALCCH
jgi:hypothetical protein